MVTVLKREHVSDTNFNIPSPAISTELPEFAVKLQRLGDKCMLALKWSRIDTKGQLLLNFTAAKLSEPAHLGQCFEDILRSWNKKPGFHMKNCPAL